MSITTVMLYPENCKFLIRKFVKQLYQSFENHDYFDDRRHNRKCDNLALKLRRTKCSKQKICICTRHSVANECSIFKVTRLGQGCRKWNERSCRVFGSHFLLEWSSCRVINTIGFVEIVLLFESSYWQLAVSAAMQECCFILTACAGYYCFKKFSFIFVRLLTDFILFSRLGIKGHRSIGF